MDLFNLDLIMMILFLVYGVLCLYNAYRLRGATKLFPSIVLYPGGVNKEDCSDPERFMRFMQRRIGILGFLLILVGGVYALKMRVDLPKAVSVIHVVATVAILAWGFWIYRRAAKQFW